MAWSSWFINQLASPDFRPAFFLEAFLTATDFGVGYPAVVCSSYRDQGPGGMLPTMRIASSGVTPQTWSYDSGAWSVEVADTHAQLLAQKLRRGTLVKLKMGDRSWDVCLWETFAIGRVQTITNRNGRLQIEVWDLLTSLRGNFSGAYDTSLFQDAGTQTTTASSWTLLDSTLDLSSAIGMRLETGGTGVVKIISGGLTFYLTYTGISGNQLTGMTGVGAYGTTAPPSMPSGQTVYNVALLRGHPLEIAQKLLQSTGIATNGSYDTYPIEWGYGLPEDLIDNDGILEYRTKAMVPATGTYQWDILVEAPVTDGLTWFQGLLALAGAWLCCRQGQITARCAQDTSISRKNKVVTDLEIFDADLLDIGVEWWDSRVPVEYGKFIVISATDQSTTSEYRTSLPCDKYCTIDCSDIIWNNELEIRDEMADRMSKWALSIPEIVSCKVAGLAWCRLCVGDVLHLTSSRIKGRLNTTIDGFDHRQLTVLEFSPNLIACTVDLTLASLPATRSEEWES